MSLLLAEALLVGAELAAQAVVGVVMAVQSVLSPASHWSDALFLCVSPRCFSPRVE